MSMRRGAVSEAWKTGKTEAATNGTSARAGLRNSHVTIKNHWQMDANLNMSVSRAHIDTLVTTTPKWSIT